MDIALISSSSLCVIKVEAVTMNNNHATFQSRTQNGHPYPVRQRGTLHPMQAGGRGKSNAYFTYFVDFIFKIYFITINTQGVMSS